MPLFVAEIADKVLRQLGVVYSNNPINICTGLVLSFHYVYHYYHNPLIT